MQAQIRVALRPKAKLEVTKAWLERIPSVKKIEANSIDHALLLHLEVERYDELAEVIDELRELAGILRANIIPNSVKGT